MNSDISRQREYYNERWSQAAFINKFELQRLNSILKAIETIAIDKPMILDFGCGRGWLTSILNILGPTSGIDLSDNAVDNAKKLYPTVNYVSGNVLEYPFEKGSFDIVVSQEVIEHIDDQKRYLEVAADCLKKDGYLILTTPNAFNLSRWKQSDLDSWGMQPIENWLTTKQLRDFLSPSFEICEIRTLMFGFASKGVFRLINSRIVRKFLEFVKLKQLFVNLMLRFNCGLHIIVVAKRTAH